MPKKIGMNLLSEKMISIQTLKLTALALSLVALLGACASSSDSSSAAQESQEVQAQLLGDMPLPAASDVTPPLPAVAAYVAAVAVSAIIA